MARPKQKQGFVPPSTSITVRPLPNPRARRYDAARKLAAVTLSSFDHGVERFRFKDAAGWALFRRLLESSGVESVVLQGNCAIVGIRAGFEWDRVETRILSILSEHLSA